MRLAIAGVIIEDLGGDRAALPARPLDQRLADDALEGRGELCAHLLLLVRREHVDDAVDRLRRILGVQGGEDEVAGLGGGEGHRDRLEVAELADEDDVRVLAQHVLQRVVEAVGVVARPRAG